MCLDAKSVVYTVRNECKDMQCVCMYGMEQVMVQQTVRNSGQCEKVLRMWGRTETMLWCDSHNVYVKDSEQEQ